MRDISINKDYSECPTQVLIQPHVSDDIISLK